MSVDGTVTKSARSGRGLTRLRRAASAAAVCAALVLGAAGSADAAVYIGPSVCDAEVYLASGTVSYSPYCTQAGEKWAHMAVYNYATGRWEWSHWIRANQASPVAAIVNARNIYHHAFVEYGIYTYATGWRYYSEYVPIQ
jgi:hypothetical protein